MKTSANAFPAAELERIVHELRHARGELSREGQEGSWRRHLAAQLDRLQEQFESLLVCWVADPDLQQAWRACLHQGAETPTGPALPPPPWFVGASEVGSRVEVLPEDEGGYEVRLDGKLHRRLDKPPELRVERPASIQLETQHFTERFSAEAEALDALRAFAASAGPAPQRWALELVHDGLIDWHFRITERGQRRLAEQQP